MRRSLSENEADIAFELNKLFYELLKALDFRVIPVAVRILWNREELPPVLHRATPVIWRKETITVM